MSALETRLFAGGPARQLVTGAAIASGVPSAFAVGAALLERSLAAVPVLAAIASGVLLSTTFSVRALGSAARDVVQHLPADLERARFNLRALCSRDASELGAPELVAATVESLAENTSDSIVAPLFYFALFGVPGAVFYRAVNTLDAMIGYHGRYEYFGKVAARLDDALNFVPARLTALLLIAAGAVRGLSARGGWLVARRDHRRTESPNAGWPMAAMAGLLGVQLEKRGAYRLGDATLPLDTPVVARAWQVVTLTTALAFALTALTATWRAAW